jgi:hypothetical protein
MRIVECAYNDGAGSGAAPLTWAQRFMWDVIAAADTELAAFDVLLRYELPAPVSLDVAVDLLRAFVLRHPTLRMTIEVAADGTPVQHIRASGTLRVPLCEVESPISDVDSKQIRAAITGTTTAQMCQPAFMVSAGMVAGLAMRISHLAVDRYGMHLLTDDLEAASTAGVVDGGVATPSPISLAQIEQSSDGTMIERRALNFAEAVYADCPPTMWPNKRRPPERPRFLYGELRSSALLASMDALTRDQRIGRAGILVGALAAVAASSAGLESALLYTISNNRFHTAWRRYPGQLSQEAIIHVPVRDTIAETMRTAATGTMRSLQAARYSPDALTALRRRVEWERGVFFDQLGSAIVLNLMTDGPRRMVDSHIADEASRFTWTGSTDRENLGFYLDAFPTATEFVLSARVNTALISASEAEAWLYAVEWAIVASAAGEVTIEDLRTRLGVTEARQQTLSAGGEQLIARLTGAELVRAQSTSSGDNDSAYICYVYNPRHFTTPEEMHKAVMAELPAAQPAVAPVEYIVVGARPTDPSDPSAWADLPTVSRGNGR